MDAYPYISITVQSHLNSQKLIYYSNKTDKVTDSSMNVFELLLFLCLFIVCFV